MRKLPTFAYALCACATVSWSSAASADKGMDALAIAEHIFAMTDIDKDGSMSLQEYSDAGLDQYGVSFEDFDLDEDEGITLAEYRSLFLKLHPHTKGTEA